MSFGQTSFINAPFLYVNGLQLTWSSFYTLTVSSGQARDIGNNFDINLMSPVTIDGTRNGINALDQGTLQPNTWYRVFILYSSNLNVMPACILSKFEVPLFPQNYDYFKRIGWVVTDSGGIFVNFLQCGNNIIRKYQWGTVITVLTDGPNSTFTPISLGLVLPPSFTNEFDFCIAFYSGRTTNMGAIRPSGSLAISATAPIRFNSVNSNTTPIFPNNTHASMIPGLVGTVPTIEYAVDTGSYLTLGVLGFTDYI